MRSVSSFAPRRGPPCTHNASQLEDQSQPCGAGAPFENKARPAALVLGSGFVAGRAGRYDQTCTRTSHAYVGLYVPLGRRGCQRARSAVLTYEWVGSQGLQCLAPCTLHSVIEASTEVSFRSKGANFAWHATCIMGSGPGKNKWVKYASLALRTCFAWL